MQSKLSIYTRHNRKIQRHPLQIASPPVLVLCELVPQATIRFPITHPREVQLGAVPVARIVRVVQFVATVFLHCQCQLGIDAEGQPLE